MPALDGLEVCRRMRALADPTPVLMLTAKDAVADRVEGLDAGADDYLVKPFALLELFLEHPRQVLPRGVIIDRVWGYDGGTGSNSLEVFVGYLRRKTEDGDEPRLIQTVRGVGYVLREQ
jgi:two-component system response regulator MprA